MRRPRHLPPRRRAWLLLELLAGLILASTWLGVRGLQQLHHVRLVRLRQRRTQAYFLARALAAELPLSLTPARLRNRRADRLRGIARDLRRLRVPARLARTLASLRVDSTSLPGGGVRVRVLGPGVREIRKRRGCP